jgi:hypothetical protein
MIGNLGYALRTFWEEAAEFRFAYPLMAVPEAGPKESLHYYWYKYKKNPPKRTILRLDKDGIGMAWARTTGVAYMPGYIAMYGLANLGHYLRNGNREHLDIFLNQSNWLEQNAVTREDGAVVWQHNVDLQEGTILLKAPWVSSNTQGLVISALIRAWRITRRPRLLELLKGSSRMFEIDWASGGVRVQAEGHIVYTEFPGLPAPGIMDGFMTSLLGLFDLYVETDDKTVYQLFLDGIEGLKHFLPRWDYRKKWSFYSNRGYLCQPMYHWLNQVLLISLARVTGEPCFAEYGDAWNPVRLSVHDRAEIYVAFLLTKNGCRLKHRTWRQKTQTTASST